MAANLRWISDRRIQYHVGHGITDRHGSYQRAGTRATVEHSRGISLTTSRDPIRSDPRPTTISYLIPTPLAPDRITQLITVIQPVLPFHQHTRTTYGVH